MRQLELQNLYYKSLIINLILLLSRKNMGGGVASILQGEEQRQLSSLECELHGLARRRFGPNF